AAVTLSLHDALPIFVSQRQFCRQGWKDTKRTGRVSLQKCRSLIDIITCDRPLEMHINTRQIVVHRPEGGNARRDSQVDVTGVLRSEEHTSELQSREK